MAKFILSGFADEIDPQLDIQLKVMNELEIGHIEVRGIDGVNISNMGIELPEKPGNDNWYSYN